MKTIMIVMITLMMSGCAHLMINNEDYPDVQCRLDATKATAGMPNNWSTLHTFNAVYRDCHLVNSKVLLDIPKTK